MHTNNVTNKPSTYDIPSLGFSKFIAIAFIASTIIGFGVGGYYAQWFKGRAKLPVLYGCSAGGGITLIACFIILGKKIQNRSHKQTRIEAEPRSLATSSSQHIPPLQSSSQNLPPKKETWREQLEEAMKEKYTPKAPKFMALLQKSGEQQLDIETIKTIMKFGENRGVNVFPHLKNNKDTEKTLIEMIKLGDPCCLQYIQGLKKAGYPIDDNILLYNLLQNHENGINISRAKQDTAIFTTLQFGNLQDENVLKALMILCNHYRQLHLLSHEERMKNEHILHVVIEISTKKRSSLSLSIQLGMRLALENAKERTNWLLALLSDVQKNGTPEQLYECISICIQEIGRHRPEQDVNEFLNKFINVSDSVIKTITEKYLPMLPPADYNKLRLHSINNDISSLQKLKECLSSKEPRDTKQIKALLEKLLEKINCDRFVCLLVTDRGFDEDLYQAEKELRPYFQEILDLYTSRLQLQSDEDRKINLKLARIIFALYDKMYTITAEDDVALCNTLQNLLPKLFHHLDVPLVDEELNPVSFDNFLPLAYFSSDQERVDVGRITNEELFETIYAALDTKQKIVMIQDLLCYGYKIHKEINKKSTWLQNAMRLFVQSSQEVRDTFMMHLASQGNLKKIFFDVAFTESIYYQQCEDHGLNKEALAILQGLVDIKNQQQ